MNCRFWSSNGKGDDFKCQNTLVNQLKLLMKWKQIACNKIILSLTVIISNLMKTVENSSKHLLEIEKQI